MPIDFERLILSLMSSLTATPPWRPFLNDLENYLACQTCSLIFRARGESGSGLIVSETVGEENFADIFDTFRDSPFSNLIDDKIVLLSQLMSETQLQKNHPRHFDYHQRQGVLDTLALNIADAQSGMLFCFRFRRSVGSRAFTADDVAAVEKLLPYLKAAVSIYARLLDEKKRSYISDKTYSQLEIASVTIKDSGEILSMNSFAESLITTAGDFFMHGGKLRFISEKQDIAFRRGLAKFLEEEQGENSGNLQIPGRDKTTGHDKSREDWNFVITRHDVPFEFKNDMHCVLSLIFRKVGQRSELSSELLEALFKLTPAEARLAKCLVEGDSLGEAAEKLGRLERTARNQLASIFAKTGVHKQHQLISHILQTAGKHRL